MRIGCFVYECAIVKIARRPSQTSGQIKKKVSITKLVKPLLSLLLFRGATNFLFITPVDLALIFVDGGIGGVGADAVVQDAVRPQRLE